MEKVDRDKFKTLFLAQLNSRASMFSTLFREFIITIQKCLKKEEARILKRLTEESERRGVEDTWDWFGEDYYMLRDDFPKIHRNSILVTIYAEFELELISWCATIDRKINSSVNFRTWFGGIWEKATDFFKDIVKIDFTPELNDKWEKIKFVRQIRNSIVHKNGFIAINDQNRNIIRYIENKEIFKRNDSKTTSSSDQYHKIELNDNYLNEVLNIFESFFKDLVALLYKWMHQKS